MPRVLPAAYLAAREMLGGHGIVFLDLMRVELDEGVFAYLVNNDSHVVADGHTFQASSFGVEGAQESAGAGLTSVRISVSNISRRPAAWIEADGIIDRDVTLWLALESELPTLEMSLSSRYTVTDAIFDDEVCTLDAGPPSSLIRVPSRSMTAEEIAGIARRSSR